MASSTWFVKANNKPKPFRAVPESRLPRESGKHEMMKLISLVDGIKRDQIGQANTWRGDWKEASFKLGLGLGFLLDIAADFLTGLDQESASWTDQEELYMFVLGMFSAFRAQVGPSEEDYDKPLKDLSRAWLLHKADDSERYVSQQKVRY